MDKVKLSIAIPASIIADTPHLREKTSKIGLIGRAAAIFRVNEIIVYPDNPRVDQSRDLRFIALLLNYLETPQYLRKRLFKIEPDLQFAGILPPLRTPHHPSNDKIRSLKVGEYREGVVISEGKEGLLVDIGFEQPALLRERQHAQNDRLTLQVVTAGEKVEVQAVSRDIVPSYWGYVVHVEKQSFAGFVSEKKFDLTIGTARIGDKFMSVACEMGKKWQAAGRVLIGFGAPTRGLHEIVKDDGARLEDLVDFVVNTIPNQGTATVRTEEALLASLAILNAQFNC
jgi:methyltransferase